MSWKHLGGCKPMSAEERFAIYSFPVPEAGCHLWLGQTSHNGYGRFKVNGKQTTAHRYAWEMKNGPIPTGMQICHKCDTPSCVNVDHLFLGTAQENADDKVRKNRQSSGLAHSKAFKRASGEKSGISKLTWESVRSIRGDSRPQRAIAAAFGVSQATIYHIKHNRTWREHG